MDQYDFTDPNYDFGGRSAILARRLREASGQANAEIGPEKGQMVGGFYVAPNPGQYFNAVMQKVLGSRDVARAEAEQEALNKEQLRRYEDISKQLATPGSMDYSRPEDLAAENSRRMGLAMQMGNLQLPMAQKVAQDYLSKGATFPEALAQLQMKQIEAGQQNAMRLQEQARIEREREEGRNERAAQHNALMMTLKQMGRAGGGSPQIAFVQTVDENGNPVTQVVDKRQLTPGTQFGKAPTAAERKATAEANISIANINDALERVKNAKPSSFGVQYAIPGAEVAGQYLDKEGIEPRAVVSNIGSMKIHDRSGATVTISEFPRLAPFVPSAKDNKAAIQKKLGLLRDEYQRIADEWGRDPGTKPKSNTSTAPAGPVNFSDLK